MTDPPPSYPTYPGPPPSDRPGPAPAAHVSSPPDGRAQPLGALTGLTIGAAVAFSLLMCVDAVLVWDARATWLSAAEEGRSALDFWTPYELTALGYFPVMLAAYVITCLWLHRARTNVEVLAPRSPHARSRGWVWGGWLVPIVSFWFPYQVVRDVLRLRWHQRKGGALLGWWWGLWLTALTLSQVESNLVPIDEISPGLVDAIGVVSVATAVVTLVCCAAWIRVVQAIAADQRTLLTEAGTSRA